MTAVLFRTSYPKSQKIEVISFSYHVFHVFDEIKIYDRIAYRYANMDMQVYDPTVNLSELR